MARFGKRDVRWRAVVGLCVCGILGEFRPLKAAGQQAGATWEAIERVWRQREEATKTIHFEWTESYTHAKGSLPAKPAPPGATSTPSASAAPAPTPPDDVTHEMRHQLTMDGSLFRYTREGPDWVLDEGRFLPRTYTSVFDGKASASHHGAPTDGSPLTNTTFPMGFLFKADATDDIVNWHIWGILLAFRPLYTTSKINAPAAWVVTTDQGVVGGRSCVLLKKRQDRIADVCWVDVSRACSVARYDCMVDGHVYLRLDISHEPNDSGGWIPTAWNLKLTVPTTSQFKGSGMARVTAYTINEPVDRQQFDIRFPRDTWVEDLIAQERYIVREDGTKRLITTKENLGGGRYLDFLRSDSGEALLRGDNRGRSGRLIVGIVLAIAVASVCAWVLQRWRRKRSDVATHG